MADVIQFINMYVGSIIQIIFSCPIVLSSLPLYGGGPNPIRVSSYLGLFSLLLNRRLSLVADIVIGCRVVSVVLPNGVYYAIQSS